VPEAPAPCDARIGLAPCHRSTICFHAPSWKKLSQPYRKLMTFGIWSPVDLSDLPQPGGESVSPGSSAASSSAIAQSIAHSTMVRKETRYHISLMEAIERATREGRATTGDDLHAAVQTEGLRLPSGGKCYKTVLSFLFPRRNWRKWTQNASSSSWNALMPP